MALPEIIFTLKESCMCANACECVLASCANACWRVLACVPMPQVSVPGHGGVARVG